MSFNEEAREFVSAYDAQFTVFNDSFYGASPNRLFGNKTFADYATEWEAAQPYEQTVRDVGNYPAWSWPVRLLYWFLNHESYLKYQWIVHKRRETELKTEWNVLVNHWLDYSPAQPVSRLNIYDSSSYLSAGCFLVLTQISQTLNVLIEIWNNMMKTQSNLGVQQSAQRTTPGIDDQKLYAEICGYFRQPLGTSIERLKRLLSDLNFAYIECRLPKPAHIEKYGPALGRMSRVYSDEAWAKLESRDTPLLDEIRIARTRGEREAEGIWLPAMREEWDRNFLIYVELCAALLGKEVYRESKNDSQVQSAAESLPLVSDLTKAEERLSQQVKRLKSLRVSLSSEEEKKDGNPCSELEDISSELKSGLEAFKQYLQRSRTFPFKPSPWIKLEDIEERYKKGLTRYQQISSLPEKAMKAIQESIRALIPVELPKPDVNMDDEQKKIDQVCYFYAACGYLKLDPLKTKPETVWPKIRPTLKIFHTDRIRSTYKDEMGNDCKISDHQYNLLKRNYEGMFNLVDAYFGALKNVRAGEISLTRAEPTAATREKFRKLGKELIGNVTESSAFFTDVNDGFIECSRDIAKSRRERAKEEKRRIEEEKRRIEEEKRRIEEEKRRIALEKSNQEMEEEIRRLKQQLADKQKKDGAKLDENKSDSTSAANTSSSSSSVSTSPASPARSGAASDKCITQQSRPLYQDVFVQPEGQKQRDILQPNEPSRSRAFSQVSS